MFTRQLRMCLGIAHAAAGLPWMPLELVGHVTADSVEHDRLRDDHVARFGHEPVIVDGCEWEWAGGDELIERPPVILTVERESLVLRAGIERGLGVVQLRDGDTLGQGALFERVDRVRELDLRLVWRLVERRVAALAAVRGRHAELRRDPLVVLEIAESIARTEFGGRRLPAKAPAVGHVARVVRLRDAQLTQVVVHRQRVVESRNHLAGHPDA